MDNMIDKLYIDFLKQVADGHFGYTKLSLQEVELFAKTIGSRDPESRVLEDYYWHWTTKRNVLNDLEMTEFEDFLKEAIYNN